MYDLLEFLKLSGGSSAGEHFVDIEGVTGSIPVSPTINFNVLAVIFILNLNNPNTNDSMKLSTTI